jgi:hypothetical protein
MGYRLPRELLVAYLTAYHQAAQTHLGDFAPAVIDWLSGLIEQ